MNRLLLPLVVAFALLATPASASAEFIQVNSNGDAGDISLGDNQCDADAAAGVQCTLRAAIQTSNSNGPSSNTIGISGLNGGTITLGSQLPDIQKPAHITGGFTCAADDEVGRKPCVEVGYASSTNLPVLTFNISANPENALVGTQTLALINGSVGLRITGQTKNMFVTNTWVGLRLDGTPAPNIVGIRVDGDAADGNVIGGDSVNSRNVISHNTRTGIDIEGADDTVIAGNYIGVKPNGTTEAGNGSSSTTGENVEITSGAQGTVIGSGQMQESFWSTPECDGGCNVIADAGADAVSVNPPNIDVNGESADGEVPASGVTIRGNYIGLGADGETHIDLGSGGPGVEIGNADAVTIGGPTAGDMNRINGAGNSVQGNSGAASLVVQNNQINLNFAGTAELGARGLGGGFSLSGNDNSPPLITQNRIAVHGFFNTAAISLFNEHGIVTDNFIGVGPGGEDFTGGAYGIRLSNQFGLGRTLVAGNVIDNVRWGQNPDQSAGILMDSSDDVDFFGNEIGSPGDPGSDGDGIRIAAGTTSNASVGNVIGGDVADRENRIFVLRTPILVSDPAASTTIGRNAGLGGAFPFIDLGGDGPGNSGTTNGGIDAPAINVSGVTFSRGTGAAPGAVIRVFAKATSDIGEVQSYLGQGLADSSGNWQVAYAVQPDGRLIVATQTDADGNTSELSAPGTTDATPPPAPTLGPGPASPTNDSTPTFTITVTEPLGPDGTLTCRVGDGTAEPCMGGTFTPAPLADGPHTLVVTQTDRAGNASSASREFVVDTQAARPGISGPSGLTRDATPTFTFTGEEGASFTCSVDGAATGSCAATGFTPGPLADGVHRLAVTQTDRAGNVSAAATRAVRVDSTAPQTTGLRHRNSPFDRTPTFRFRSSEAGSSFQCKVDRRRFRPCRSPYAAPRLRPGRHVLRVRAVDRAGNVDRTPLRRVFRVRDRPAA